MTLPIAMVGGRNQIAVGLLRRLAQAGRDVIVHSKGPRPTGLNVDTVRWSQPPHEAAGDVASMVYTAPLPAFETLRAGFGRIGRVIAFSSTSALTKAGSASPAERALAASLVAGEVLVRALAQREAIPCAVLRPTLIYGVGIDRNLTRIASWARGHALFPLARGGRGLRQPVHAEDLAELALSLATSASAADGIWNTPGAEALSYREMVCRVYGSIGRRPRFVPLPLALVRPLLAAASSVGRLKGLDASMFARMGDDLVFDGERAADDLGFQPRGFAPDAATWRASGA